MKRSFDRLYQPLLITSVRLKNRITMAPLFTGYANQDGTVSNLMLKHYHEVAAGGAAMIVVANASVDPRGTLASHNLRVDHDRFIHGLSRLARTIKSVGAVAVLQINHGGRFARSEDQIAPSVVSMSSISYGGFYKSALKSLNFQQQMEVLSETLQHRSQRCREMTRKDIRQTHQAYATAAARAQTAGFNMVEIHGATGYLPVQFLSSRTNRRTDGYGGDLANRMRFALELVQAVRQKVGDKFPVGYRFLTDEWLPNGFRLEEAQEFARHLANRNIAYLSITAGTYESFFNPDIIMKTQQPAYMADLARKIKKVVTVPVICTGKILSPSIAENILRKKQADLIGLARPLFTDPQWPTKAFNGKQESILKCQDCQICMQMVLADRPVICSQWDKIKLVKRKMHIKSMNRQQNKILLVMDGSDNAALGAAYAGKILAHRKNVSITLLHIQTDDAPTSVREINRMMDVTRSLLISAGLPADAIEIEVRKKTIGIARDILTAITEGRYGTVVIGRRGLSRAQQFLFGSVSHKVVQNAKNCTVWVVD